MMDYVCSANESVISRYKTNRERSVVLEAMWCAWMVEAKWNNCGDHNKCRLWNSSFGDDWDSESRK